MVYRDIRYRVVVEALLPWTIVCPMKYILTAGLRESVNEMTNQQIDELELSLDEAIALIRQYVESDYISIERFISDCKDFLERHDDD